MSMLNEHYQEMHGGEGVQCATCFRYTKDGNPVRHTEDCAVGIEEKVIASASSRCPICGRDTPHTHPQTDLAAQMTSKAAEFGALIPGIVRAFGGSYSTAHKVASAWFAALEAGEFGPVPAVAAPTETPAKESAE